MIEQLEVERQHDPSAARGDVEIAFALQPEQRLADRRARDAETLGDLGLREAVAGHDLEVEDVLLELGVGAIGELRRGGCPGTGAIGGDGHGSLIRLRAWSRRWP